MKFRGQAVLMVGMFVGAISASGCSPGAGSCQSDSDCFRDETCVRGQCVISIVNGDEPDAGQSVEDSGAQQDGGQTPDGGSLPGGGGTQDSGPGSDTVITPPEDFDCSFAQIFAGGYYSCALTTEGQAYCWGQNDRGQLGDNTFQNRATARAVQTNLRFQTLALSERTTCGVALDGKVYCWGSNAHQQLGGATSNESSPLPLEISGNLRLVSLNAGENHFCGLTDAGAAHCWGSNERGQLGLDPGTDSSLPRAVTEQFQFKEIIGGRRHSCAIRDGANAVDDGIAYCWGFDRQGILGNGSECDFCNNVNPQPGPVVGNQRFVSLSSTFNHTCGLTQQDKLFCWGWNSSRQISSSLVAGYVWVPTEVTLSSPVGTPQAVVAGHQHTCVIAPHAISRAQSLWCWGIFNPGANTPEESPVWLSSSSPPVGVASGINHTCVLHGDGKVRCWGNNRFGQLGNGTFEPAFAEVSRGLVVCGD
jgi:alpha-tubulin suppressor-like RCC1 family protein